MRTKPRLWVIISFAIVACVASAMFALTFVSDEPTQANAQQSAPVTTNALVAIDLSGRWESNVSKSGTKMVGEVKNGKIHIEMYADEAYTGLWYGTFDILQPGEKTLTSKYIDDPEHFVLSNALTKDFTYDSGALKFDFSVMGTRTTVEMRRVAG